VVVTLSWSIASLTRGFSGLSSDTPRSDQAATKRSYPDEKRSVYGSDDHHRPAGSRLVGILCPARQGRMVEARQRASCLAPGGCHDRRLLQHDLLAAGALARAKTGGAILARSSARTQRPRRHALRALRPSSRFAPSFVLCPGPLVATLWMQWRYLARLGDPSGLWTAVTSRPLGSESVDQVWT
jgi:hypothetical protein